MVEDPLQSQRLKYAFESEKGLLGESPSARPRTDLTASFSKRSTELFSPRSFDASEQQRGQQTLLPVCQVPGHVSPEVSVRSVSAKLCVSRCHGAVCHRHLFMFGYLMIPLALCQQEAPPHTHVLDWFSIHETQLYFCIELM